MVVCLCYLWENHHQFEVIITLGQGTLIAILTILLSLVIISPLASAFPESQYLH